MEPDILRTSEGIQLSFILPHQLNDVCIYPQKPANGSDVIIYAHDEGLRVVWYAGRRLKKKNTPRVNGNDIDLTEDEDRPMPEYEEHEAEVNSMRPFRDVLTYTDIHFGTAVTKIAVPPLSAGFGDDLHKITNSQAVVLAACADLSLRLVLLPLDPPSGKEHQVQKVVIDGPNTHQDLVSAVAVTLTPMLNDVDETRQVRSRSHSRGRGENEGRADLGDIQDWSLLLASTSTTGTGLLLVHQIPFDSDGRVHEGAEELVPVQRRFLKCPLAKCTIDFNPSLYPSARHSHLLIASSDGVATKIYQAIPHSNRVKKRRGSTATVDSTTSTSQTSRRVIHDKVLIDLLLPFGSEAEQAMSSPRKQILDAKWILHGRAVVVLLDDGDWGIWDIEAAGPTGLAAAGNLVKGQGNISGVQGGAMAKFALRGNVNLNQVAKKSTSSSSAKATDSSLAPMTPHTRKARAQGLFKGPTQSLTAEETPVTRSTSGSLAVTVQTGSNAGVKVQDESVVFSFGSTNVFIPSIQAYWRSQGVRHGPFESSTVIKPMTLPQLQTAAEEPKSMWLMPQTVDRNNGLSTTPELIPNFLTATLSRLILFVSPLVEPTVQRHASNLPLHAQENISRNQDQLLLDSGELDVDGMDRILDNMTQSNASIRPSSTRNFDGVARKSVGFQLDDDDEDTEMGTPTASRGSRNRLLVDKPHSGGNGRRTLFT